ncbi:MAG TPA: type II secretion system protein GspM [Kofleriaceae bacterium]|nr:type II secretion system protein GspM [Kofleriaceae bacterium]
MSALTDKASDFWARISPRERRLVVIALVAVPLTIAIWLGLAIRDGLDNMAVRTNKTRKALDALADMRARGKTHEQVDDVVATMGTEPLSLDTYLSNAAKKAKFELKSTITPRQPVSRNGFVTNTSTLSIENLTIDQLRDFLQDIESGSKVVAVTHLDMRRDFRDKDKIDVNLEVSTYSKERPAAAQGSGSADQKGS